MKPLKKIGVWLGYGVLAVVLVASVGLVGGYAFAGLRWDAVKSNSMEPHYPIGYEVFTVTADNYGVGDDITFVVDGIKVTHRIHRIGTDGAITTKGTNRHEADPWQITQDDISGKVVFAIPHAGKVVA